MDAYPEKAIATAAAKRAAEIDVMSFPSASDCAESNVIFVW
jgi:hypothetical protein